VGKLGTEHSKAGQSLKLTIDLDLQRTAENAFGDRNGAVIAMDPHTGEILAMLSRPVFDPNAFAVRIGREEWNKLITDPNHPLMNKTIQAQVAPGSTFKVIMSLAGLEEGVAEDLKVNCGGGATFYGHYFACDHKHGELNVQQAISKSCDTYFYTLAVKLGITKIAKWAHAVGLGQKTGVDLPDEVSGTMPSEEWKMKTFHEKWYAGETVSVGIGQGAVAVTPIQLARALSGIASGGVFKRPHVVFPDELPAEYRKAVFDTFAGSGDVTVPIDPASWETITDGMAGATDPRAGGTAFASHLENIDFAGKTGTAQVVSHSAGALKVSSVIAERPHAWFVGIAPRRNPDIVVAVLWEHGGWGSGSAHVAARVIEAFVNKQRRLNHNLSTEKEQPVEVGAVWSDPSSPDALGGKPVVAKGSRKNSELDSMRAGHFFLKIPPPTDTLATAVRQP
jgi:penicillin-binding protein 2